MEPECTVCGVEIDTDSWLEPGDDTTTIEYSEARCEAHSGLEPIEPTDPDYREGAEWIGEDGTLYDQDGDPLDEPPTVTDPATWPEAIEARALMTDPHRMLGGAR